MMLDLLPSEDYIRVENLLTVLPDEDAPTDGESYFKSTTDVWMPFGFLIGEDLFASDSEIAQPP